MIKKQFQFIFIIIILLYSCSNDTSAPGNYTDIRSINNITDSLNYLNREKYFGISLINGQTRGMGFIDSSEKTKQFRSIRVKIVNDTLIPINIQMYFSNKPYMFFHSTDTKFNAFLFTDTINKLETKLNDLLNKVTKKSSSLNKVIKPGETCNIEIGMIFLNNLGAPGGFTSEKLFFIGKENELNVQDTIISIKDTSAKKLEIILGITLSSRATYYSTVSCGKVTFLK